MALGEYLSSLNLDPATQARVLGIANGPPPMAPIPNATGPAPVENIADGAPTPDEMARYGASPAEIAIAQRANGTSPQAGNPTNPVVADPKWDPEAEQARTLAEEGRKERAAATPQGPAGDDGFPTYRDLSNAPPGMSPGGVPSGPMRVSPAHWQPGTRSESTQRNEFNPDLLNSGAYHRDVAAGHRMIEGDLRLEAAQQQGQAEAVYAASHAAASQQAAARTAQIQQQREAYVVREKEKLEQLSLKAQEQVDPEAAKGPSGAQLFAAIAIALGEFGASLRGGTNTALQIVNGNIDRRIAAQKANIDNANKALGAEQSLYKDSLAEFGDKERAALATKVQYLDQVKAMADQQYAASKNTQNEAQYHAFVAGVNDERAKAADDLAKLTGVQVATQGNEHYVPTTVVGGAGGAKGKEALYVPSLGGYARDAETARKLNTHGTYRTQINEDLHEIHGLLNEAKKLNSVTDYGRMQEVRQRIDALKAGVLQKTTVLAEQGAMSKGDQGVAEARSALESMDPQLKTEAQLSRMQKGLASVAKSHQRDARLEGESNGVQLGREEYRAGVNGPEAVARLAGQNKVVTKKTESVEDLLEKPKGESKRAK